MIESQLPILLIVVPLVAAPLCVLLGQRKLAYLLALIVTWCTFAMSVALRGTGRRDRSDSL